MGENGSSGNSGAKLSSEKYTHNYDSEEINPLRNNSKDLPIETDMRQNRKGDPIATADGTTVEITHDVSDSFVPMIKKKPSKLRGTYEAVLTRLDITKKARLPFLLVTLLCVILLFILIALCAFWPRIPYYMTADVCVDKECLESSAQILLWANTSIDTCQNPYEWACGKFEDEYLQHPFYGVNGGEWNMKTYADYEDVAKIHSFVSKLSSTALTTSAQMMLKGLHQTCMSLETLAKSESDSALKKAIFSLLGWMYGERYDPHIWDFTQAMVKAHTDYGISPFYKITVENRNTLPYGNIITISEGDVGLPHKLFYNLNVNHEIITEYQMLMRDFSINMGVVAESARKFAEQMFHFEKRIVNNVITAESKRSAIMKLKDIQKLAPSLPIFDTIVAMFPHTKISESTEIFVRDVEMLREMSIIVSTSDELPLHSFITWSLSRRYLPFMSSEYRAAVESFESRLYGQKTTPPSWYFCSKLLKTWAPFAIDALRQYPQLIVDDKQITYTTICKCITYENTTKSNSNDTTSPTLQQQNEFVKIKQDTIVTVSSSTKTTPSKSKSFDRFTAVKKQNRHTMDRINYNQELLKMIFYHLKNQFQQTIDENVSIDEHETKYINDKLSSVELQIGIPVNIMKTDAYLNAYYSDFFWRKMHFIENLKSHWSFHRQKMEDQLKSDNRTDKIISYLFPLNENQRQMVQYSIDLNTIVVSDKAIEKPYFHYKYPISVNFARIGFDLSKALLNAVNLFADQYEEDITKHLNLTLLQRRLSFGDKTCIQNQINDDELPNDVKNNVNDNIITGRFVAKSLQQFIDNIANNRKIQDAEIPIELTYDVLGLESKNRQPGLRNLEQMQLFALTYMQRHCSINHKNFNEYKPFIDGEIAEREMFDISWAQISNIASSMQCTVKQSTKCDDLL